jgi:hypothetical protein
MDATVAIVKDDTTSQSVDVNPLVDLIWKNEAAIVNIFDIKKSTLRRSNVEMFWLSLICSGIIDIVVKSDGSAQFKFGRVLDESSTYHQECYLIDTYWDGINCYPNTRVKRNNNEQAIEYS